MKHVPKYLLPQIKPVSTPDSGETETGSQEKTGFVAFRKDGARGRGRGRGRGGKTMRGGRKKHDPLKKFSR